MSKFKLTKTNLLCCYLNKEVNGVPIDIIGWQTSEGHSLVKNTFGNFNNPFFDLVCKAYKSIHF